MILHSQNLVGSAALPILTPRKSTVLVREKRALGKPELSHETLLEYFDYDKNISHQLIRSVSRGGCKAGEVAGSITPDGYRSIFVDYWSYRASRLIWFYVTGAWPENLVDHINGNRDDNRWSNLRAATYQQNNRNRKPCARNKSGKVGVCVGQKPNTWQANITIDNKTHMFECREVLEDAIADRCAAERHHFGNFGVQASRHASDGKGGVL